MTKSKRKTALITGASRGIGAETALRLACDGFNIAVNYSTSSLEAQTLVEKIALNGGNALAVCANVGDPSAVKTLFEEVSAKFGGIDVLVNNAGIQQLGLFKDVADQEFDEQVKVNLAAPFYMMREAAQRLQAGARIINLSSGTTLVLQPRYGVYAATKAGLEALTAIFAKEMRGRNITVNAVLPGPIATELYLKGKTQEQIEKAAQQSPLQRLGTPADIAAAISFLAGPDGAWINGQTFVVNGAYL